ncbi:MAG: hypothetical protein ABEJ44_03755 [Halanaeroarchaeum sp.]
MAVASQQERTGRSRAEQRVDQYMLDSEEISFQVKFRPTGLWNRIKSAMGYGVTHWFVTNQRLIQETRVGGGFLFKDVALGKISSIEYGSKVSIPSIAIGLGLALLGLLIPVVGGQTGVGLIMLLAGLALVVYAYWRRQQVLAVHASGGVTLQLVISKGKQVDEFLWYLNAERSKHT